MPLRIGVDIGGSFTDFAILNDADGSLKTLKVFSRPDRPGSELESAFERLKKNDFDPRDVVYFTHGTTVGVNSVIQRKGIKLGLFTTSGFVDVLELARLKAPDVYDYFSRRPDPLVPRERVYGIRERIDAAGTVLEPLDEESVIGALQQARADGCEGIVVSLLHSYRNPEHERAVKALVQSHEDLPVFVSSEVWPIIREYERTITATISGYVQPKVAQYLAAFEAALERGSIASGLRITKSNGGVMPAEEGKNNPAQTLLSGTAAGVIGAAYVARLAGLPRVLSLDIGGTSADVAVIQDGVPQYGTGERIGEFQVFIPSVSVSSIGEGGGSIAHVDEFGVLKVGPESAGSTPGPACYGRGGVRPTVTDSFVACGLLGVAEIAYNAVQLDREAAIKAIAPLAHALNRSVEETAEGIQRVCISGMYSGVSGLMSRFGIDPRDFTLLAFGGAGPMLAVMLARELSIPSVLVPPHPGVLSALGGVVADMKNDFIQTIYATVDDRLRPTLTRAVRELKDHGTNWVARNGGRNPRFSFTAEMRYLGQSFEIDTPLDVDAIERADLDSLARAFHEEHERVFGHCAPGAPLQIVTLRLTVSCPTPQPTPSRLSRGSGTPAAAGTARAWLDGRFHDMAWYVRDTLQAGDKVIGPAIVAQDDCTTIIPQDCAGTTDEFGNLIISIGLGERSAA